MRSGFSIPVIIQSMHFTRGSKKHISIAKSEEVGSCVWFVPPISPAYFSPCEHKVTTRYGEGIVRFYIIENEKEDRIMQASDGLLIVADDKGKPFVPTRHLTDSRGKYPCVAVEVCFPQRLDGDILRAPDKQFTGEEKERSELFGPSPMPEKLAALIATNMAIKESGLNSGKTISASDVSALLTTHWIKNNQKILTQTVSLLTTENAFKYAAEDYYLGSARESTTLALASLKSLHPRAPSTEAELHCLVLSVIDKVLIHHFDTRHLIEPFWDGSQKIKIDGNDIEIPRKPKKETEIQPTLHVFLQMALEPFGVHVIRESDEGSGSLDFRFSTTNTNSELISVAAEFKLAHHKEVKAGVTRQLPRYMDSIPCLHGVFILMWFKDEKGRFFSEPKSNTIDKTRELVNKLAANPKNNDHIIATRVIDCSVRPTASILR